MWDYYFLIVRQQKEIKNAELVKLRKEMEKTHKVSENISYSEYNRQ